MKFSRTIRVILGWILLCLVIGTHWASSAKTAEGPFNLVAWDGGQYVQLNWDADFGTKTQGYNIYRSVRGPEHWEKLNRQLFPFTSFVDYSAPRSELVFYRVNLVNENGEELSSASAISISTSPVSKSETLAQAEAAAAYDKNSIISDSQLINANALSLTQIQSFLTSHGSALANYSTAGKSAAQHIYDACQTHGISPYVVLVTLQKEKGLINSSSGNPNNFAMGWKTWDSSVSGFADQINYGTQQFKLYYNNLGSYGWTVGQSHAVSDGTVSPASKATAGLYIYTPWIGGATGIGGNYLFWQLWYNDFGFSSDVGASDVVFPATVITSKTSTSIYAREENAFWVSNHALAGQCTWYAYGRVIELSQGGYLDSSAATIMYDAFWGKSDRDAKNWPQSRFIGGEWTSTNNAPLPMEKRKPGMLAVWPYGANGHVGFVEEISADKTRYRLSDFNRGLDVIYRNIWYNFAGTSDLLLGGYPTFYQLPLSTGGSSSYDGYIDGVGCDTIFGWAKNIHQPNIAVSVDVFDGGTIIASNVLANQDRADVGNHAFSYPTPSSLKDGNTHSITARISGTTFYLKTPKSFTNSCGGSCASAQMTSPTNGSNIQSTRTFNWNTGTGNIQYFLYVGTTGVGSSNLLYESQGINTSKTMSNLPAGAIYVRLWSRCGSTSAWTYNDYSYTVQSTATCSSAQMTSPTNGSNIQSTRTFNWNTGTGNIQYFLYVGTTGVGSSNLLYESQGTNTSKTMSNLPAGAIYVRLWSRCGSTSAWTYNDYSYTVQSTGGTQARMTSPANGSAFSSTTVTFKWSLGTGNSQYFLYVGNSLGSSEYFYNYVSGGSTTVGGLPADRRNIYVRLWSRRPAGWTYLDYYYRACACGGNQLPQITNPTNTSKFSSSVVTFRWTPGSGGSQYFLYVGNSVGSSEYFYNYISGGSTVVGGLPSDGRTIYVRIWSRLLSGWTFNDYIYKANG